MYYTFVYCLTTNSNNDKYKLTLFKFFEVYFADYLSTQSFTANHYNMQAQYCVIIMKY